MKVRFKGIDVEGFGSIIQPLNFNIDRKGVTIMSGHNGSGKTTLWSALTWGCYQINLKGLVNDMVQTWEHLQPKGFKGTRSIVHFDSDVDGDNSYMIARHLKFKGKTEGLTGGSKLMLFKQVDEEWEQVGEGLHRADIQSEIERLIGLDSKTFLNSVVFGQRMARIVDMDGVEKRKLFENLFDIEFLNRFRTFCADRLKEVKEEISTLEDSKQKSQDKIDNIQTSIDEAEKVVSEFTEKQDEKLYKADEKIQSLKDSINEKETEKKEQEEITKGKKKDVAKLTADYHKAKDYSEEAKELVSASKKEIRDYNSELASSEGKLEKLKVDLENVEEKCTYCSAPIDENQVKEVKSKIRENIKAEQSVITELGKKVSQIEANQAKLIEDSDKADKEKQKLYDQHSGVEEYNRKITSAISKLVAINNRIEELQQDLDDKQDEYKKIKSEKPVVIDIESKKTEITEYQELIEDFDTDVEKWQKEFEYCEWWIKNALGSSGLKSYIFSVQLQNLNTKLVKYGRRFGVDIKMGIDFDKASKPFKTTCIKDGEEVDYNELSGGEKARIDISCGFAMHDLVMGSVDYNFLVMDELFEGLDSEGMEVAFDLIRVKSQGSKAVYVITHSPSVDPLNAKIIDFDKKAEGYTQIS